jgi:hypothetical protein
VKVTVVSIGPLAHDHTIRRGGSISSTRQCTIPSNPGAGSVWKVKARPTSGWKSLAMNHSAMAAEEVSAAHTRSRGCW